MRLLYSINVTLDGCVDHEVGIPDDELHRYHAENLDRADALLFGRVVYQMMEEAWRPSSTGEWPAWMEDWMVPFAQSIDRAKKYVVSSTLDQVDWNAELLTGDLEQAVRDLKARPGGDLQVGGVTLPLALAQLGLIDELDVVVQPVIAGRGPTLLGGLRDRLELELIDRRDFASGAVALRYRNRATAG